MSLDLRRRYPWAPQYHTQNKTQSGQQQNQDDGHVKLGSDYGSENIQIVSLTDTKMTESVTAVPELEKSTKAYLISVNKMGQENNLIVNGSGNIKIVSLTDTKLTESLTAGPELDESTKAYLISLNKMGQEKNLVVKTVDRTGEYGGGGGKNKPGHGKRRGTNLADSMAGSRNRR